MALFSFVLLRSSIGYNIGVVRNSVDFNIWDGYMLRLASLEHNF